MDEYRRIYVDVSVSLELVERVGYTRTGVAAEEQQTVELPLEALDALDVNTLTGALVGLAMTKIEYQHEMLAKQELDQADE